MSKPIPVTDAERILQRIQNSPPDARTPMLLKGDTVMVRALPENAFMLTSIPTGDPARSASYNYLKQMADIHVEHDTGHMFIYVAIVTWDTMLHTLTVSGELTRA